MLIQATEKYLLSYTVIFGLYYALLYFGQKLKKKNYHELKNIFMVFSGAFFLYSFFSLSLLKITVLSLFLTLIFYTIRGVKVKGVHIILGLVGTLFLFKLLHLQISPENYKLIHIVGFSYMVLKLIHFVIDYRFGVIKDVRLSSYLSYLLFFPVFSSGPITLFSSFNDEITKETSFPDLFESFVSGIKKIIIGLFKVFFLVAYISPFTFFNQSEATIQSAPFYAVMLFMYASVLNLYFNFSGYTDLAIGISKLFGIKVNENFNKPFLARNLQDFWQRWHISLSTWLKTYIFMPLCKNLLGRPFFANNKFLVQPVSIFITFFIMGAWHGLEKNFLIYGFFQGMGLFLVLLWGDFLKKKKLLPRYKKLKAIGIISWFLTFNYFALSLVIFNAIVDDRLNFIGKLLF